MTRLHRELAILPEMSSTQLRKRWAEIGEGVVPSVPPSVLRHLVAQRLQEKRYGALPLLVARELERAAGEGGGKELQRSLRPLNPGTRLIREWNGKTVSVDVLEDGFAYDNRTWRSHSEIARHVTGAHWSGPRFFGLNRHA